MTTRFADDSAVYVLEAPQMRILEQVMSRLYENKPLNGDQRRDLANTLYAILSNPVALS